MLKRSAGQAFCERELAEAIAACRYLRAAVHVRRRAAPCCRACRRGTGFEHHGYLNLLLAVEAAGCGCGRRPPVTSSTGVRGGTGVRGAA
jgi:hypothetical protein